MTEVSQRPINVLVVEHDLEEIENFRASLDGVRGPELELEHVRELSEALERLSRGGIDVVLLDLSLPDSEGMVTFERTYAFAPDVPIVVFAEEDDETMAMATVQGGAQDHLVKGEADPRVVVRALRHAIERHRLLSALRSLSLIDDLTGLYNRRGFADLGEQYLKLAGRTGRGVTLVYLDLDRFKTINDSLGHHVGDRALRKMADVLRATFRGSDIIARMGGDEFAVLALEASGEDAEVVLDRLRRKLEEFNERSSEPYRLAASIGMARYGGESRPHLEDLLAEADQAMHEKKRTRPPAVR